MQQYVVSPECCKEIYPAIVVVITCADPLTPSGQSDARLLGYVSESAIPVVVVKVAGVFLFSSPATVFAVSPALAAMSTKLIFGGLGMGSCETALSPVRCAKAKQVNSKQPDTSAAFERCGGFVRMDALQRILQIPQSVHFLLTVV